MEETKWLKPFGIAGFLSCRTSNRRGPRNVIIDACGRCQWEKRASEIIALN
jgi:hypothetical protein